MADAGGARRRDHPADHLPAAVHLRVRRRDLRRVPARLPAVPAARHPGPDDRHGRRVDRRQPQHGHPEGRLRPLPQPADRAGRAAHRRGAGRHGPLRAPVRGDDRLRLRARLPGDHRRRPRAARLPARGRLRAVPVLDVGVHRHAGAHPGRGAGADGPDRAAAELRLLGVRVPRLDARLAAGLRGGEPAQPARRRGAGAAARRADGRAPVVDAGLDGRRCSRCSCRSPSPPTASGSSRAAPGRAGRRPPRGRAPGRRRSRPRRAPRRAPRPGRPAARG